MRTVFVGAGSFTVHAARSLLERKRQVVIVERSKDVIASVQEELDCGFLLGDATRPNVLREVAPAEDDVLFCLTGNDQTNIIASLVGRSLGFSRVITRINDTEFEHVCIELGLQEAVLPARTLGRYLADMAAGHEVLELSSAIRGEARIFLFVAGASEDGLRLDELELPEDAHVALLYRAGQFVPCTAATRIALHDDVVVVTPRRQLAALRERWSPVRNG